MPWQGKASKERKESVGAKGKGKPKEMGTRELKMMTVKMPEDLANEEFSK